jgi:hypothetical protein
LIGTKAPDEIIVSEKDLILPGFDEIDWEFERVFNV